MHGETNKSSYLQDELKVKSGALMSAASTRLQVVSL